MVNKDKKELKKFVYAIRITKRENDLLKKNEWIKKELDSMIRNYLKIYSE